MSWRFAACSKREIVDPDASAALSSNGKHAEPSLNIGADVTLMTAVRQGRSEALGQANLKIDTAQQNRTEIGRQAAAGEIGTDTVSGNGCKTKAALG